MVPLPARAFLDDGAFALLGGWGCWKAGDIICGLGLNINLHRHLRFRKERERPSRLIYKLTLVVDSASAAALVSSDSSADIVDRMRRRNVSCAAKTRTLPVPSEQYSARKQPLIHMTAIGNSARKNKGATFRSLRWAVLQKSPFPL